MSIEKFYEEEKKKKEAEINYREIFELRKKREKIANAEKTEKNLFKLKQMLENGEIDKDSIIQAAKDIVENSDISDISSEKIQEIFDKIDEIEDIPNIDDYISKENRITKDEYKKALTDDIFREKTLKKINKALVIIADKISPDSSYGISILTDLIIFDKNLVKVQENTIDIKQNLKAKNKSKIKNLWEKIKEFFS